MVTGSRRRDHRDATAAPRHTLGPQSNDPRSRTRDRVRLAQVSSSPWWVNTREVHMKTKVWLVRAASLAVVGTLTVGAWAQKPHRKKGAAAAPAAPAAPPGPPRQRRRPRRKRTDRSPPQGNQGKLRKRASPTTKERTSRRVPPSGSRETRQRRRGPRVRLRKDGRYDRPRRGRDERRILLAGRHLPGEA